CISVFFFQAEDGIRDRNVTGVQTCALPIFNELSGHLDTVLMLNGMKHGAVEELIDGILEITGRSENVDRLLNRLQVKPLSRESRSEERRVGKECGGRGARAARNRTNGC